MTRRHKFAHFGVFLAVTARILCCPGVVIAQAPNNDPEVRIVDPIVTEETMPNDPGDWALRLSGSYGWRGTEGSGFLPREQLFFGIAKRWGGEVEVPMAFAKQDPTLRMAAIGVLSSCETSDVKRCSFSKDSSKRSRSPLRTSAM